MAKKQPRPWVFFPNFGKANFLWVVMWILWIPLLMLRAILMWLGILRRTFDDDARRQDIVIWGYSNWIMAWIVMAAGPILWGIDQLFDADPVALNWAFCAVGFVFLIAVVPQKFKALHCLIYGLTIAVICLGGLVWYLYDGTNIFAPVRDYFSDIETAFSGKLFLKISGILALVILPLTWIWAFWDGRWVVTANGIYHKRVFGRTTLYKHSQIRFQEDFEHIPRWLILFGGGNLRILRTNGALIEEVPNILSLALRWPKIMKLWEAVQTSDAAIDADDDEGEAHDEPA